VIKKEKKKNRNKMKRRAQAKKTLGKRREEFHQLLIKYPAEKVNSEKTELRNNCRILTERSLYTAGKTGYQLDGISSTPP
jgi:hypothetical protein